MSPRSLTATVGPLLLIGTTLAGWFAFAGAQGDGPVSFALFVGSCAITLMAWSFLLAVRIRPLEDLFGGLDRMYWWHRWAGVIAIAAVFLHTQIEPDITGGILGASRSVAHTAAELADPAKVSFYVLAAISVIRWIPYRVWRWTHKLMGIPYAISCWHFFTAEKPYANDSVWGWYFGTIMVVGLVAYVFRVVVRDMLWRGRAYTLVSAEVSGGALDIELKPEKKPIKHRAGQFAVLKVQERGLSEPHSFTIASPPGSAHLRFHIKELGGWTRRLAADPPVGTTVLVEGPYGRFRARAAQRSRRSAEHISQLWIAGGVGITPFLSNLPDAQLETDEKPVLIYCFRDSSEAVGLADLKASAARGEIELHLASSTESERFSAGYLNGVLAGRSLEGAHVAMCGPASLLKDASTLVRERGASHVETEAFDIRGGVGPR